MKRQYSLDLIVGLFIISGMLAFVVLALKVSGLSDFSWNWHQKQFVLKANFSNIGGLKVRSRVTIAGVTVGRVTDIVLDTNNDNYDATVIMDVRTNLEDKIPDDSVASIRTAGLIGDNYISITPGGSEVYLRSNDYIYETHSALVLEDLVSKFLYSKTTEDN